jgi:hypothetical protein
MIIPPHRALSDRVKFAIAWRRHRLASTSPGIDIVEFAILTVEEQDT